MAAAIVASIKQSPRSIPLMWRTAANTTPRSISLFPSLSRIIRRRPWKSTQAGDNNNSSRDLQLNQNNSAIEHHWTLRPSAFKISPFGLVGSLSPIRTMWQMLDTMDRLFQDAFPFPVTSMGKIRTPWWDIKEDEKELKMRFDMPGLSKEEVKVSVENDLLVIRIQQTEEIGEGREREEGWRRSSSRVYDMRVVLPEEWEKERVKAEFENGVLIITIPKVKVERNVVEVEVQ